MYQCSRCTEKFLYVNDDQDIECVHCGHVMYNPDMHKMDVLLHAIQEQWLADMVDGRTPHRRTVANDSKLNAFVENSQRIREDFKSVLLQKVQQQQAQYMAAQTSTAKGG